MVAHCEGPGGPLQKTRKNDGVHQRMKQFILTFYKKHRTLRALPLSWEGSPKKKDQKSIGRSEGALRVQSIYALVRTVGRVQTNTYCIFNLRTSP